jgi:hypothetical protein
MKLLGDVAIVMIVAKMTAETTTEMSRLHRPRSAAQAVGASACGEDGEYAMTILRIIALACVVVMARTLLVSAHKCEVRGGASTRPKLRQHYL